MSPLLDPRERLLHRAALTLFALSAIATGIAAAAHARQPGAPTIDRVAPAVYAAIAIALALALHRRPAWRLRILWAGYAASLGVIGGPAWWHVVQVATQPGLRLVETLPPIAPAPLVLVLSLLVFLEPRQVLRAGFAVWLLVASPILGWLVLNPQELLDPRGIEIAIVLGPLMLLVLVFLPALQGFEHWITALQRESARMAALAERDALTGLLNRRAGEAMLVDAAADADHGGALILFDLDGFKGINDRHGHGAGDEVLRHVAQRCRRVLRDEDLLARWGGEEFLVLARGADEEGGLRIAENLRLAIAGAPIVPVGVVTASFGVARAQAYDTVDAWLARADRALYAAKRGGRNRVERDTDTR